MRHPIRFPAIARMLAICAAALLTLLVSSCGGSSQTASGVDSGGTGIVGAGPVTGLGSAIVNGVEFDLSSATIVDQNGNLLSADQVALGQMLRLESASAPVTSNGQKTASAVSVEVRSQIVGPVDAINTTASTLTAMGQTILITPATWFDPALSGGYSSALVGSIVEIYGQFDPARHIYVATRIEPHDRSAFKISGLVSALDSAAQTMTVGGIRVSYANVAPANLPAALAIGSLVQSRLQITPRNTANGVEWNALNLLINRIALPDRPYVQLTGRITSWRSASNFDLDGIPVNAASAILLSPASGVVAGARVLVNGTSKAGVLIASDLSVLGDETSQNALFELHGLVSAIDSVNGTAVVHGMKVVLLPQTAYQGGSANTFVVGARVKVTGVISSDRASLDAQSIGFQ